MVINKIKQKSITTMEWEIEWFMMKINSHWNKYMIKYFQSSTHNKHYCPEEGSRMVEKYMPHTNCNWKYKNVQNLAVSNSQLAT